MFQGEYYPSFDLLIRLLGSLGQYLGNVTVH